MILRRLAALVLALVLLAGWQEALQHPLRHAAGDLAQSDAPVCKQHGALDAVLGAIGGAAPAATGEPPVAERIASFIESPATAAFVSPSSRDPPALL